MIQLLRLNFSLRIHEVPPLQLLKRSIIFIGLNILHSL